MKKGCLYLQLTKNYISFLRLIFTTFLLLIYFSIFNQSGGETCASATLINSIPYVATGSTISASDDYFASCDDYPNQGGANDLVYAYTNGSNSIYVDISLCEDITDYDCQLYLFENSCLGNPVGCQEDGCQSPNYSAPYNSRLMAQLLQPNTTYYIVVDGFSSSSNGSYQLNISESVGLNAPDSSKLPLVLIQTNGAEIVDEPKINVDFKIIGNGFGNFNSPSDFPNQYDGIAGVEIRGSYSATLPQKPFGIETRDALGDNNNVSIFGMPDENDWILLANYNDKTFMRNILSFDLFTKMGHYAPRTELCEVVINDIYNGIYVFTEKIKRDNGRVDIAKLDFDDNLGDSLTGGYIFKVDYWNWDDSWASDYTNPNFPNDEVRYVYNYPKSEDITSPQQDYIQNIVSDFEDALWGVNFTDSVLGYRPYINTLSFIDYFIVNEFARNVDGFKKSRNFFKDKDSKDPLIYAGPVWDFDWAYKDHDASMLGGSGWRHDYAGPTDVKPPGWYIRLLQDSSFTNELSCRYFNLRNTILDTNSLFSFVDSIASLVDVAQQRHYVRWPILGINVGTPEIGFQPLTYQGEVNKFKNWIIDRLDWLDINMPGNCPNVGIDGFQTEVSSYVVAYPNPCRDVLSIYSEKSIEKIEIYDLRGALIFVKEYFREQLIDLDATNFNGIYNVKVFLENDAVVNKKLVSY